jgi:sec-independent protein translocase protein TatC
MDAIKDFFYKFSPYLEDIRKKLYKITIVFIVVFGAGFLFAGQIIKYLIKLFDIKGVVIATTSPFQFADLAIDIGLFFGLIIVLPMCVYQFYGFLKPALSKSERKSIFLYIPISVLLFLFGFTYGFMVLYYALIVLAQINIKIGVQNIWDIGMFLSQITITAVFLGVLFEFPIIINYLVKMGIITTKFLKEKRRIAFFVILIFTTLLPPTDGLSLMAMALPLILLYEITIFVNSRVNHSVLRDNMPNNLIIK